MSKKDTIQFDYDAVQKAYEKMTSINEEAVKLIESLDALSKSASEKMKGKYRKNYDDKSEDIIDDFKDTIKEVSKLSDKIQTVSKDFLDKEMVLSASFEHH